MGSVLSLPSLAIVSLKRVRTDEHDRDGAALAGALLEEIDRRSISGIFATHLHELFELPLQTSTLSYKRMAIDWVSVAVWRTTVGESCSQGGRLDPGINELVSPIRTVVNRDIPRETEVHMGMHVSSTPVVNRQFTTSDIVGVERIRVN